MRSPVDRVTFGWAEHPDARYASAGSVIAPHLSVRLGVHDEHVFFRADLNPSAAYTVFPLAAAFEVSDLIPGDLDEVCDPVLRHLKLGVWKGNQKVEVYGRDLQDHLALRLPLAFDVSGTTSPLVSGRSTARNS